ncbi:hypothetical protein R1flu_014499 [Riccia fluitans]|uniref:DUF676 domain-containing protein n=1 Tax=Riccia fluitans TaxID=41844 RepID=A0ABD1YGM8_9MARC
MEQHTYSLKRTEGTTGVSDYREDRDVLIAKRKTNLNRSPQSSAAGLRYRKMGLVFSKSDSVIPEAGQEVPAPAPSFTKISESVYELYADENPNVEIVFFHGLQFTVEDLKDAYWRSFTYKNGVGCWPMSLLPESLAKKGNRARVLTVCYDTSATKHQKKGRIDIYNLADQLVESLITSSRSTAYIGQRGVPVILVGHSLGGILIKQVVAHVDVEARLKLKHPRHKMLQKFLGNLKGVFYMSTPHHRSQIARWESMFPEKSVKKAPVLGLLEVLSKDTSRLNKVMFLLMKKHDIKMAQVNETEKTNLGYFNEIVVKDPPDGMFSDPFIPVPDNHITICRPESSESVTFKHLLTFIENILAEQAALQKKLEIFRNSSKTPQ